jgi:hypothetical protein
MGVSPSIAPIGWSDNLATFIPLPSIGWAASSIDPPTEQRVGLFATPQSFLAQARPSPSLAEQERLPLRTSFGVLSFWLSCALQHCCGNRLPNSILCVDKVGSGPDRIIMILDQVDHTNILTYCVVSNIAMCPSPAGWSGFATCPKDLRPACCWLLRARLSSRVSIPISSEYANANPRTSARSAGLCRTNACVSGNHDMGDSRGRDF